MLLLRRKMVSAIILTLMLAAMLTLAFNVQSVRASGTVYIRADGSIDPPTASIYTADNVTYTLTGNFTVDADGIVIERGNIVLDGAGYTVTGSGSGNGTTLIDRSNVTVRDLTLENFGHGVWFGSTSGCILSGNNVTGNNDFGIVFESSPNSIVSGNNVADNNAGVYLGYSSNSNLSGNNVTANKDLGIAFESSSNSILSGNNVTNNAGGIEFDFSSGNTLSGNNVTKDLYGIMLSSFSDNNVLSGNNVTANSMFGIILDGSSNNTLSGNVMRGNLWNFGVLGTALSDYLQSVDTSNLVDDKPVYYFMNQSDSVVNADAYPEVGYLGFVNCANVTVQGLNLTGNGQGLLLAFTNDSKIIGNNAANNFNGIEFDFSSGNTLAGNNVTDNLVGIELYSSSHNTLSGNGVKANSMFGIALDSSSSDNRIFHNDFVGNSRQIASHNLGNIWDDGYPSGGNYWSDYNGEDFYKGPYQDQTGSDGIGDTPYVIDANNKDRYPLGVFGVHLLGDLNHDGIVDILDAIQAASAFGSSPGHLNWNSQADLNNDNIINIFDIIILAGNFGKTTI